MSTGCVLLVRRRKDCVLKTVDRALRLLLLFDEIDREYRVGEMASILATEKSIVSRLAATLAKRGFLERAPDSEAFRLGPEFVRLGMLAAASSQNMVEVARVPMESLAEDTGETVNLARLEEGKIVNIAQADGPRLVGVGDWVGWRTEPHTTANGKVLLAFMDDPLETLDLEDPLEAVTEQTITSVAELRSELERVRDEGAAITIGELEPGFNGVAVPVFDPSGRCSTVLSVSGPEYRMPPERLSEVVAASKGTAEEISARLGRIPQRIPQL